MEFEKNELSKKAKGGTELLMERLYSAVPEELLNNFQIIPSRVRDLKEDKIRILYCHDLENDPESEQALGNSRWQNYHLIVFVSNWQMQRFIYKFNIPWTKCLVIKNSIELGDMPNFKINNKIRLVYTSTPHRGLDLLVPVFKELKKKYSDIELDVFSSFALYGWKERDKQYQHLFDECKSTDGINYHGTVSNSEVRKSLQNSHILAYPNTWQETSCLCLIEAMASSCYCVHPNYGALYETSGETTDIYQYIEDKSQHAYSFMQVLDNRIKYLIDNYHKYDKEELNPYHVNMYNFVNLHHNTKIQHKKWKVVLENLLLNVKDTKIYKSEMIYDTKTSNIRNK